MYRTSISQLAPPAVSLLIVILAYGSQVFFRFIEPYHLERRQTIIFNTFVSCIWITYARACVTDPGRIPKGWASEDVDAFSALPRNDSQASPRHRWCRKCEAFKPRRAHHCKTCQRCIPKMDHHCPWTVNCVSHRTFPHFMRFLFYAVTSISYLEYLLFLRAEIVWSNRKLPSYLGPSPAQLIILLLYLAVNSLTLFALAVMFLRSLWSLCTNTTTIEGWEIERHHTLLRRSRTFGGYLDTADGDRIYIRKQEFPYDIGIWRNIVQGMYGGPFTWFWPLASTYPIDSGLTFEINGFEDANASWPPPDPDRLPRKVGSIDTTNPFTHEIPATSNEEWLAAFRKRQQEDLKRLSTDAWHISRRQPFHLRYGPMVSNGVTEQNPVALSETTWGEESWRNSEGERLEDFGVDELAEFYDEDDLPLAELLSRRQAGGSTQRR